MTFIINRTNTNYSASQVHACLRLETNPQGLLVCFVNSYASLRAFEEKRLNWQDSYPIPVTAAGDPQSWLIGPEGPFAGATTLVESTPLETAKSIKWAEIKGKRSALEAGGFPYLGKLLDSDKDSVMRMTVARAGAQAAISAGNAYSKDWTCADNSVITLTAEEVVGMLPALDAWGEFLFSTAHKLRLLLEVADSLEAVNAMTWPIVTP